LLFAKATAIFANNAVVGISYHGTSGRFASSQQYTVNRNTALPNNNVPPITGGVTKDAACGDTKGCFSDCDGGSCQFVVSWTSTADKGQYTLQAPVSGQSTYIAIGFSSDAEMGDDDVIGCAVTNAGNVLAFSAKIGGKTSPSIYTDSELQLLSSSYNNNVLSCTLERPKSATTDRVDLELPWNLLFAKAGARFGNNEVTGVGKHARGDRFVSSQQYTVNDRTDSGSQSTERVLVKYHGSFMTIAWLFFASVGILMPRYFKNGWEGSLFSQKVWFQIHRLCMVLVLCLTAAGFIAIFVEMEDWSELDGEERHLRAHPIMGTVVMGLTLLNPIMALFRPSPDADNRKIFNVLHYIVGQGGFTLAVVTVYFGVLLDVADTPYFVFYILIGYSVWSVLVEVLMSAFTYCCSKTDRSEAYELGKGVVEKKTRTEDEQAIKMKKILLGFHVVVTACIAGTITAMIAIGEEELEG